MFIKLITTSWGIPIIGQAASNQALGDSILEMAKESPLPADIFSQGPFFKKLPEPAWMGARPATLFASDARWQSSGEWSLPVPIEIAKPPMGSGKMAPIKPKETAETYVQHSLSGLLARVVGDKKYGFSRHDADALIGDLWFVLDQLAAAGKKTDPFWIWILNELMWGNILENPSNKKIADEIVSRFLPWIDRFIPEDRVLQRIASSVLSKPLITNGFHNPSVCYRHLSRLLPSLEDDPFFARTVVRDAVQMTFTDPGLDINARMETIEKFLAEVSTTLNETVTLEEAWHAAYHHAWAEADETAILRLEALARAKKWDKKNDYPEICQYYRQAAMEYAISGLEVKPFSAENCVKLVLMLQTGPFARFETEFLDVLEKKAVVTWMNIEGFAHFIRMLWTRAERSKIDLHTIHRYREIINRKLKEQLQSQLPELMSLSPDGVVNMKAALTHADDLLEADIKQGVYLEMAQKIAEESLPKIVEETLTSTDKPASILEKRWRSFRRSWQMLMISFKVTSLLEKMANERVAGLFAEKPPEEIGEALHELFTRMSWIIAEWAASALIARPICSCLQQRLFKGQSAPARKHFVDELEKGVEHFSIIMELSNPSNLPWLHPPEGTELIGPTLHTERQHLETSYRLAKIINLETSFLALIRRALAVEIGCYAELHRTAIFRNLSATEYVPLKEVIQEIAGKLHIVIA